MANSMPPFLCFQRRAFSPFLISTDNQCQAIYSKTLLLQQILKSWHQICNGTLSEAGSHRSSVSKDALPAAPEVVDVPVIAVAAEAPGKKAPPAPPYPLLFSRALRPIRVVLVPSGKDPKKVKDRNRRAQAYVTED